MHLKPDTLLQGGKYRIIRTLGQGGFGITYEAEQVLLRRKVALKEFFMKDCCERDDATSQVTIGTGSQRSLVEKFRLKFVREAQMMAGFDHPHIVRVLDVFEENGTAYYVMENLPGGSLSDKVKKDGTLSEVQAEKYIRQVADALSYIHSHNTVHLDVKPSNILLNSKGDAVLIDFGISKHYDVSGEQTSSTPVGISKGYAPLEQGKDGDVSQFKPSTDIYALGATLYHLVTGIVPPDASDVNEDGLKRPNGVSDRIWTAIVCAMQPRRKDRPQSIEGFLSHLDGSPDANVVVEDEEKTEVKIPKVTRNKAKTKEQSTLKSKSKKNTQSEQHQTGTGSPSSKRKNTSKVIPWIIAAVFVSIGTLAIVLMPNSITREAKREKPQYDDLVKTCFETIEKGNIDSCHILIDTRDSLLRKIKEMEDVYSQYDTSYHQSSRLELELSEKMATLKDSLEALAEAQMLVSVVKAKEHYELAAQLADTPTERERLLGIAGTFGKENGHEWVDLGLSVKWATMNVGASNPNEYGSRFAWGEISPRTISAGHEYKWWNNNSHTYDLKYNSKDGKKKLELGDDAAHAQWGGSWRMPTRAEMDELRSKCDLSWTVVGGKRGFKVTSKTNGNSIFLPATNINANGQSRIYGSFAMYWTSSISSTSSEFGYVIDFNGGYLSISSWGRDNDCSVRAVTQ